MTAASVEEVKKREEELLALREAAKHLGAKGLADGTWFSRLVAWYLKKHGQRITEGHWDRVYPRLDVEQRAIRLIDLAAIKASAAGAAASIVASSGELLALYSEGVAAPIGVPAAIVSMLGELVFTTILQVELACDLASVYGVPFDVDDMGELATLFAVAKHKNREAAEEQENGGRRSILQRLIAVEEGEVGSQIGHKLVQEGILKNVVPFVGIAVSAPWNYITTRRLGASTRRYIRYRRAITVSIERLRLVGLPDLALLVEGAWLLATVDGVASHEEMLAIALLADDLPPYRRTAIEAKLRDDDEDGWLARLSTIPESSRPQVMDAFYLFAAIDRVIEPAERRFLRRVATALGLAVDLERAKQICNHLVRGEELSDLCVDRSLQ
ncbi:MAG: hypothetical protein NVSMB1_26230 [Polyangiales bacterium]